MTDTAPTTERCEVCAKPAPEWAAGWAWTDDGRCYCPEHKGDRRFRQGHDQGVR